jgi:uroporphyrinogen III methyltransferase/synthase
LNSESNSKSPLAGLTVLVTRPERQAQSMAGSLRKLGADVLIEPVIEILPPTEWSDLDRAIRETVEGRVSTLVFVSVNGVRFFVDRSTQLAQTAKLRETLKLAEVRVLGIGRATCEALADRDIEAMSVPGKSDSSSMANFLIDHPDDESNGKTLIVRADRGSDLLPDCLSDAGFKFEQVVAYRSVDRKAVSANSMQAMAAGEIDWVTVTSSAIAESAVRLFGETISQTKLVSISPTTSTVLRELGYSPAAEATAYNMSGIIEAIIAAREAN